MFSFELQSPQPIKHVMLHCAPTQLGVPWFELQALLQPPQLDGLLLVSVSHPSRLTFSLTLQLLCPASHTMVHTPLTQSGVP
jgi:hypothetical protein